MNRWCIGIGLGLAAILLLAGCQQPRADTLDRLAIGEVMMHAELAQNLRALALPGGRVSGTANAGVAENFVADKLRAYGLQNVHLEPFDVQSWIVYETRVTLLTDPPRVLADAVALSRTISTPPEGITADLISVGEATPEQLTDNDLDVTGKFVLLRADHRRMDLIKAALARGAAGVVFMAAPDRAPIIGNGHAEPRPEPVVVIRHEPELLARLESGTSVRMNIVLQTANWWCHPNNVVGEIPGHGPLAREVVLLGAHLDSWHLAEGAMDNGIGSAVMLEVARALAHIDWRPRRTVRFVWFMAEEIMLDGSTSYVREHTAELDKIVAVFNADMPGSPRKLGHCGHPEIEPFLKEAIGDLAGYELDRDIGVWTGEGSDHAPFMKQGICALGVWGDLGPGVKFYHTPGDTYESVDHRATLPSAAVYAVLARRLADMPDRLTPRHAPVESKGH